MKPLQCRVNKLNSFLLPAIPEETEEWAGRIVGGSTASSGQFRYQASLRSTGNAVNIPQATPAIFQLKFESSTSTSAVELCSRLVGLSLLPIAQLDVQVATPSSSWEPSRELAVELPSEFLASLTIHHTARPPSPTTFPSSKLQAMLPPPEPSPQLSSDQLSSEEVSPLLLLDGDKPATQDQPPPTCSS